MSATLETSTLSIPPESEQAAIVRQFVRLACHRYGVDGATDTVLQVTDELVENAIAYGSPDGTAVDVGLVPQRNGVRIEVRDHSPVVPDTSVSPAAPTGDPTAAPHGLQIVASLAESWGVTRTSDGKVVWAEITAPSTITHA
jgi:anti-sigma regulatory factor (Ser/Thr protein kinase)